MRLGKLKTLFIIAFIAVPTLTIIRAQVLTVGTEEPEYEPSDKVEIFGTGFPDENITLTITLDLALLEKFNVTVEEDGNYSECYELTPNAPEGNYTITATWGEETAEVNFAVINPTLEELAETLIDQALALKEEVEDMFEDLEEKGIDLPESANNSYYQGLDYLELAEEHFDAEDYSEAASVAHEAIEHLGFDLTEAQTLLLVEDDEENEDKDDKDTDGLPIALERAYDYWNRLNDTVAYLEEGDAFAAEATIVLDLRELLDKAREKLNETTIKLSEGNLTAAREAFTAARGALGRIHGFLMGQVKLRKEKHAERFLERFRERVQNLNRTVERLREHLEEHKAESIRWALQAADRKLEQLRHRFRGNNLADALDELETVIDDVDGTIENVNGKGFSNQLKLMNMYEAKIQALNRTLELRLSRGENIEVDEQQLDGAKQLLENMREMLSINLQSVEGLLEEMEDNLEDLKESLRSSNRERVMGQILEQITSKLQAHNSND